MAALDRRQSVPTSSAEFKVLDEFRVVSIVFMKLSIPDYRVTGELRETALIKCSYTQARDYGGVFLRSTANNGRHGDIEGHSGRHLITCTNSGHSGVTPEVRDPGHTNYRESV